MLHATKRGAFLEGSPILISLVVALSVLPAAAWAQVLAVSEGGEVMALDASEVGLWAADDKDPSTANAYAVEGPGAYFGDDEITADQMLLDGVEIGEFNEVNLEFAKDLRAFGDADDPETIKGVDTRVEIRPYNNYPSRAVVLITFSAGRCSGNLIGDDTVLTAGHCVHSGRGGASGWYPISSFRIYPGADGSSAPYGSCTARELWTNTAWTSGGWPNYDYAAIKLDCTTRVGWFGFRTGAGWNTPAIVSGYPGDKPLEQWQSADQIKAVWAYRLFYPADTVGGMSGSGVWQDWWVDNISRGPYINAVHAYGASGSGMNSGTRMTRDVFNFYLNVKNRP